MTCTIKINTQAEKILTELQSIGFSKQNVSILFPDRADTKKWVQEKHAGGVLEWLAGIGSLAIPGIGPFIAAGPILAALSGSVLGAAMGGVTAALVGLKMSEYEAKIYERKIKEGLILISVHIQDVGIGKRKQALIIFKNADASEI